MGLHGRQHETTTTRASRPYSTSLHSPDFVDVVRLDLSYRLLGAVQDRLDVTQFLDDEYNQ